jgi:hypothetical protein
MQSDIIGGELVADTARLEPETLDDFDELIKEAYSGFVNNSRNKSRRDRAIGGATAVIGASGVFVVGIGVVAGIVSDEQGSQFGIGHDSVDSVVELLGKGADNRSTGEQQEVDDALRVIGRETGEIQDEYEPGLSEQIDGPLAYLGVGMLAVAVLGKVVGPRVNRRFTDWREHRIAEKFMKKHESTIQSLKHERVKNAESGTVREENLARHQAVSSAITRINEIESRARM